MNNVMTGLQKFGKGLMGAVAVMPVAALLMGIGYAIDPVSWGGESVTAAILIKAGAAVLDNLGYIFAIALAFGLAKDSNGASALSGFLGFTTVKMLIEQNAVAGYEGKSVDGLKKLIEACANYTPEKIAEGKFNCADVPAAQEYLKSLAEHGWDKIGGGNVLIGILVGLMVAWIYNRFHATKLPDFLAFFSGRRLVPILTTFFAMLLALVLYFVWPALYYVLFQFGQTIQGMGAVGAGLYGFFNRLLIPTGMHHAMNQIFWFNLIGINDLPNFLGGAKTIELAQAATDAASCPGTWTGSACEVVGVVGRYQGGFFPVMMFGLPAAGLAMYLRADEKRKKTVGSLMMAGALASFFTGVTEPLEFSFMFVAPLLYLVHAILTGISVFIAATLGWTAGFGFSAGAIDFALSTANPIANQPWMLLVLGVVYAAVYFVIFYGLIGALNLRTPGRGDDSDEGAALSADAPMSDVATHILAGLGGVENIESLDYCATRLRVSVRDNLVVKEAEIKKAGVAGIVRPSQKAVQVIVGPQVQFVYDEMEALLRQSGAKLLGEQEV